MNRLLSGEELEALYAGKMKVWTDDRRRTRQVGNQVRQHPQGIIMRYQATFIPQQTLSWLGDDCYPADPKGDTQWDCTEYFMSANYTDAEREEILNDWRGSELTDSVRGDPSAPEWVREWDGPFEVSVTETA